MPPEDDEAQSSRLGPEAVARMTFPTSFRGYDPEHVRGFLESIAAELREARDQEAALQLALEAAEARVESVTHPDEAQLTELLGEETVRVLMAAREAAAEIRAKGEESVARLLREAQDDVTKMKAEAEAVLDRKTQEAEAAADAIRRAAEAEAATTKAEADAAAAASRAAGEQEKADARLEVERIRAAAHAEAQEIVAKGEQAAADAHLEVERIRAAAHAEAEQIIEAAKAHGREMVEEALLVRTRVLEDLSRKRKAARVQLERLQAGRERLLESYEIVRRTLEEATGELRGSLTAAKRAADSAARRAEAEPAATVEQLDAEVTAARDAGLPLVEDEGPDEPFDEELPAGEMVAIQPSADFEEVRLVSEPAVPEPTVLEPEPEPEPEPAVVAPEPEPVAAEPEPVPEPVVEPDVQPEPVLVVEEVEELVVVVEEAPEDETEATKVDVDELFARIRAARAEEVAKAQQVLAPDSAGASAAEPDDEPANATEAAADESMSAPPVAAEPPSPAPAAEVTPQGPATDDDEYERAPVAPDDQALLERRDGVTDAAEQAAVRKLKRVLADEQNEVLDRLRRNSRATLDDLLPPRAEHAERYGTAAASALFDAAAGGAMFYEKGATPPSVDALARELGEALTVPLRDRISASLREAAGDDEALADGVRATYRDWKTHRIQMQARDSVFAAFNLGLYEATPRGTRMRWLVDDGGSPCPDAEDNSLAGLVARGEPYPTGHCYPPAHPGCRCLLVPASH